MRPHMLLVLVLMAGCVAEPEVEVVSYRDQGVPIASQVDVTWEQIASDSDPLTPDFWQVRFATPSLPTDSFMDFRPEDGRLSLFWQARDTCGPEWRCSIPPSRYWMQSSGSGRWLLMDRLDSYGLLQGREITDLWVLWADADRRTLAIGNPEGTFGFILDREPTGGEDRIAAARDIMVWMGYRVEEMVP